LSNSILAAQYHIARMLMQPDASIDQLLQVALHSCAAALGVERAALVTLGEDGSIAYTFAVPPDLRLWEHLAAQNLINHVLYSQRVLSIPDLSADER
jgi:hypothetical protein